MESSSNQISVKRIKIYLRFFKVATLRFVVSFAHSLVKDYVHIMARTAQISKETWQSIITFRHGQSIWKISRTLKASSSAVAKTFKRYDETGSHEERHRKGEPERRISPLVWWVQTWDFWFQPPGLCETQSSWTDDLHMCGSHREAWMCEGVGVLCWWHCLWFT